MKIKYVLLALTLCLTGDIYPQFIIPKLIGPPGDNSISQIFIDQMNSDNIFIISTFGGAQASFDNLATIVPFGPTDSNFPPPELVYVSHNNPGNIYLNFTNQFLVSMDYGETWETKIDKNLNGEFMGVNPLNSAHLFLVVKDTVLIESFNHGDTFNEVLILPGKYKGNVAFAQSDTNIVYACTSDGLLKSTNGGKDWFIVNNTWVTNSKIIINPQNSDTIILDTGSSYYLYKSIDGGKSFIQLSNFLMTKFVINPIDTTIYYALHTNNEFGIYKTTDSGETWFKVSSGYTDGTNILAINPDNPDELLAAVPTLGIFKSTDAGENWFYTERPYTNSINGIYLYPGLAGHIYVCSSGWDMQYTINLGEKWERALTDGEMTAPGSYYGISVNPFDKNEWYTTRIIIDGDYFYRDLFSSSDGGLNWQIVDPHPPFNSVVFHPVRPGVRLGVWFYNDYFYTITEAMISVDNGENWQDLGRIAGPSIIFSPFNENTIISYGWNAINISTDLGNTWTELNNGLITENNGKLAFVDQVLFSPFEENVLYCCQTSSSPAGGVFKSTDLGNSWKRMLFKDISGQLNSTNLLLDDRFKDRYYISTNSGLYLTENDGENCIQVLGPYGAYFQFDDSDPRNIYFISRYGLETFVDTLTVTSNEDIVNTVPDNFMLYQNYPNPFNPSTKIKYSIPLTVETRHGVSLQHIILKVYDILGREVAALVNEYKNPGTYEVEFNAPNLASGVYIVKMKAGDFHSCKKMILLR